MINGSYPDVHAFGHGIEVIGEAKPPEDLESDRSKAQLKNFLTYVQHVDEAHLALAVQAHTSATAWNTLRVIADNWQMVRNKVHILDGINSLVLLRDEETQCE